MNEMPELTEEQRKELEEKLKNMSPEEILNLQKQQCIFCQIIGGKVPSKKIYEDDKCVAILDINPATKGHILLLPKEHYAIMPQIPDEELSYLFLATKSISQIMLKTLHAPGTNIFIANGLAAGQRAQHFMIHIIPRREGDGLFKVEEKIIDKKAIQNVKTAVENKLNELLGVSKKVVTVEEKEEQEQEKEEVEEPKEKKQAQEETKDINERETEPSDEDTPEDETDDNNSEETNEGPEEEGDASLDDIANLFK
jgi:histidine triad (HIT) family protein